VNKLTTGVDKEIQIIDISYSKRWKLSENQLAGIDPEKKYGFQSINICSFFNLTSHIDTRLSFQRCAHRDGSSITAAGPRRRDAGPRPAGLTSSGGA